MGRRGPLRRQGRWLLVGAVLAAAPLFWAPVGCSQNGTTSGPAPGDRASNEPRVRVRLLAAQTQALLSATEPPIVRAAAGASGPNRLNIPSGSQVALTLSKAGAWTIGDVPLGSGELTLEPAAEASVSVNGKPYRGTYRFVPVGGGKFDVVNHVDVDSYLKSVVPKEMFREWDPEAYKAQAIAARTYALYEARTAGGGPHWDLFPDVRSQVYGGYAAESDKSRDAVDDTAGIVLAARNEKGHERIFKAYFSSCCGGITQSAYDAFGEPWTEPLSEQYIGPVCNTSKWFNWGPVTVRKDELTRRFRAWGKSREKPEKDMGDVATIKVAVANRFGRPVRFEVVDGRGNRFHWRGEELRWAVNYEAQPGTTLRSSFCRIVDNGDTIAFVDGHGFGHGVGLCQYCAQARAEAGWAHEDIVLRSFPRSKLVRAY
jgi:stage II sporulation protein D